MGSSERRYRAGEAVEDFCRACKTDRLHTIVVTDTQAQPLRVSCGYCHSEHNYRGGPRVQPSHTGVAASRPASRGPMRPGADANGPATRTSQAAPASRSPVRSPREPFPLVSERERTLPPMSPDPSIADLELILRRVIREETGLTPVAPADRWRGGSLVLRPGTPGLQEKS